MRRRLFTTSMALDDNKCRYFQWCIFICSSVCHVLINALKNLGSTSIQPLSFFTKLVNKSTNKQVMLVRNLTKLVTCNLYFITYSKTTSPLLLHVHRRYGEQFEDCNVRYQRNNWKSTEKITIKNVVI